MNLVDEQKILDFMSSKSNQQPLKKVSTPLSKSVTSHYIVLYIHGSSSKVEGTYISQSFIKTVSKIRHFITSQV
jgi:hypothetical protein